MSCPLCEIIDITVQWREDRLSFSVVSNWPYYPAAGFNLVAGKSLTGRSRSTTCKSSQRVPCTLHRVKLYLFGACGLWWGSKILPSMYQPPGKVCRLHYEHQSCDRMPLYVHWRHTCSQSTSTVDTFLHDSGAEYKCTDLPTFTFTFSFVVDYVQRWGRMTYLLTYLKT